jgi:hypothetical protein
VKRWTLDEIAREPRWPLARTLALPGTLRGNALRAWGLHVRARFGHGAPDKVRAALGLDAKALPDVPTKKDSYPVHVQLRMIQCIIDDFLGGDALAFESVFEETSTTAEKTLVLAGRMTGPGLVLRMAGTYHESVCSVGRCIPEVSSGRATLDFQGADIFGDPTWRFSNMVGMQSMFTSLKRRLDRLEGEDRGESGFIIHMAW